MSFKDSFSYFCNCFNDVLLHTLLVTKVRGMIFVLLVFPRRKSVLQSKFTRSQVKYESLCVFGKNDSSVKQPSFGGHLRDTRRVFAFHLGHSRVSCVSLHLHLSFISSSLTHASFTCGSLGQQSVQ